LRSGSELVEARRGHRLEEPAASVPGHQIVREHRDLDRAGLDRRGLRGEVDLVVAEVEVRQTRERRRCDESLGGVPPELVLGEAQEAQLLEMSRARERADGVVAELVVGQVEADQAREVRGRGEPRDLGPRRGERDVADRCDPVDVRRACEELGGGERDVLDEPAEELVAPDQVADLAGP
jgi:hypothetical protein